MGDGHAAAGPVRRKRETALLDLRSQEVARWGQVLLTLLKTQRLHASEDRCCPGGSVDPPGDLGEAPGLLCSPCPQPRHPGALETSLPLVIGRLVTAP